VVPVTTGDLTGSASAGGRGLRLAGV